MKASRRGMVASFTILITMLCAEHRTLGAQGADYLRLRGRLLAGIALSANQQASLDADRRDEDDGIDGWIRAKQRMRVILTPTQQQVFDVNATADDQIKLYTTEVNHLLWRAAPKRHVLMYSAFYDAMDYYCAVCDSLRGVSRSPIQMQEHWQRDRQKFLAFLTSAERQEFELGIDSLVHDDSVVATLQVHDPKRLLPGIVLSYTQRTKLSPIETHAVGAPDSVWQKDVRDMRAVLKPDQQRIFDVNATVDSEWKKYAMAYKDLWGIEGVQYQSFLKNSFIKTWNHHRATVESLQNVSQTPAQMQQLWETDRQALRDILNRDEKRMVDELVRR